MTWCAASWRNASRTSIDSREMMESQEFYPDKTAGIVVHALLLVFLLGGITVLLILAFSQPAGWPLALILPATLGLVALLPLAGYRAYALWKASYTLERDGLRVRWGLRSEDLPVPEVLWVRPASDLVKPLSLPRFAVPGAILGSSHHDELGEVEFIASSAADLVIVAAVDKTLVLSPEDPEDFSQRFQRVIEMGSLSPIDPHTAIPAAYMNQVFRDQLAKVLLAVSLGLTLLLLVGTSILIPFREQVSIGFDVNGLPLPAVASNRLLMLPVIAIFFAVFNLITGLFLYRRKSTRVISYFIWASGILNPLLLLIAVGLVMMNPV